MRQSFTATCTGSNTAITQAILARLAEDSDLEAEVCGGELHIWHARFASSISLPVRALFRARMRTAGEVRAFLGGGQAPAILTDRKWQCPRLADAMQGWREYNVSKRARAVADMYCSGLPEAAYIVYTKAGKDGQKLLAVEFDVGDEHVFTTLPAQEIIL